MIFKRKFRALILSLALVSVSFADRISTDAISKGGEVTRDRHLKEIGEVLRGGRGGYFGFGMYYTPLVDQLPLQSEYGKHDGFAFRHHISAFGAMEYSKNVFLGALLWLDRAGWDGEDFLLFPEYNDFSLQRSVTTWGVVGTNTKLDLSVAAGMQHQNVEHVGKVYANESDSLAYFWAHARWNRISAQGNFYRTNWRSFRVSMDLESREVFGGVNNWQTYLPNLSFTIFNRDVNPYRLTWEQNIYQQNLYAETTFEFPDAGFHSAALKYYPDASRMMGFELTCVRRNQFNGKKDLLWGGAVDLMFLRLAYNAAYDYDNFFGAKGTFLAEIKFNISSIDGKLFSRGGAKAAPMESNTTTTKNKDKAPEQVSNPILLQPQTSGQKVIEAKGIRYENNAPAKGGK